jgi:arylsulfatase A-like enzyme
MDEHMDERLNVVLMVIDGHGYYTGNMDWGTREFLNLRDRMDRLRLVDQGYIEFTNMMSPAASTIMSIESILSGIYAAKTHKFHWRQWPPWDRFEHPTLTTFLKERGYEVQGFSYLLNSENWIPSLYIYRPDLYEDYPSFKRDTHSHEAVLAALRHYFENVFDRRRKKHCLIIHSIFLFDIWEEIMKLLTRHGFSSENTIFALTSDHYFPYGFGRQWLLGERDQSMIFHHTDLTEHNTRVFFYLKYPGCTGARFDHPVAGYDITPTILDLMNALPEWPSKFDGVSLVPLICGGKYQERFLRSDNVYPFQIGEKQGRITSIKKGKYKYVFRPDPISSYIAYRMTEEWSIVLEREEFYQLDQDAYERSNLIRTMDPRIQNEIATHREFYDSSQEDVIKFHIGSLGRSFIEYDLKQRLFRNRDQGRLLCFQSCPPVVFRAIVGAIREKMPRWEVDVVIKQRDEKELARLLEAVHRKYVYPFDGVYEVSKFTEAFAHIMPNTYDCILNTSSVPMGDYVGVYDESEFPVGDFAKSSEIIQKLRGEKKGSLGLNMSFRPLPRFSAGSLDSFRSRARKALFSIGVNILTSLRPYMRKLLVSMGGGSSKMPKVLCDRIIRTIGE